MIACACEIQRRKVSYWMVYLKGEAFGQAGDVVTVRIAPGFLFRAEKLVAMVAPETFWRLVRRMLALLLAFVGLLRLARFVAPKMTFDGVIVAFQNGSETLPDFPAPIAEFARNSVGNGLACHTIRPDQAIEVYVRRARKGTVYLTLFGTTVV